MFAVFETIPCSCYMNMHGKYYMQVAILRSAVDGVAGWKSEIVETEMMVEFSYLHLLTFSVYLPQSYIYARF